MGKLSAGAWELPVWPPAPRSQRSGSRSLLRPWQWLCDLAGHAVGSCVPRNLPGFPRDPISGSRAGWGHRRASCPGRRPGAPWQAGLVGGQATPVTVLEERGTGMPSPLWREEGALLLQVKGGCWPSTGATAATGGDRCSCGPGSLGQGEGARDLDTHGALLHSRRPSEHGPPNGPARQPGFLSSFDR